MNASGRGTRFKIAMDGAFCIKGSDGSVTIRKRSFRNYLVLVFLAICLAGVIALAVASVGRLFQDGWSMEGTVDLCTMVSVTGVMTAAVLVLVRSLRRPSIHINATSRVLEIGQGLSRREVGFADISRVSFQQRSPHAFETKQVAVIGIGVALRDGSTLQLGTVSGEAGKTWARADQIARLIAETINVEWRAPTES
jgi:hypothetical protein